MTDDDLVSAAKAFGFKFLRSKRGHWNVVDPDGDTSPACHHWPKYDSETGARLAEPTEADALREYGWMPDLDADQALELAAKLRIDIRPGPVDVMCYAPRPGYHQVAVAAWADYSEPRFAICAAIVLAASRCASLENNRA